MAIVFNGISSADRETLNGDKSDLPPDCNGAVNYSYFVEFINGAFSIYDKKTGSLKEPRVTDFAFWDAAGIANPGNIDDPRIVFIPDAGRHGQWLAVQLDMSSPGRFLIATTNPLDPLSDPSVKNRKWKGSEIHLPPGGPDFTMLGYGARGVYIGYNRANGDLMGESPMIVFIPRANALAYPPKVASQNIKIIGPLDEKEYGENLFPVINKSGVANVFETAIGVDTLSKKHLTFSLISPLSGAIMNHGKIEVEPFEPVPLNFRVKQPSGLEDVAWVNSIVSAPTSDGSNIWVAHTILKKAFGSLAVRWYRLFINPVTRVPSLGVSGEILDPNYDFYNPSIFSLGRDDYTVVSLSRSGDSSTPTDPNDEKCGNIGAYVALVRETDPNDAKFISLMSGKAPNYDVSYTRWGDFSTIRRDPEGGRRVWTINEYVLQGGKDTSEWCNVIASIDVPVVPS